MSDQLTPEPEDRNEESQLPPAPESPPRKPVSRWISRICFAVFLLVTAGALLLPALQTTRCSGGATRSVKEIQAERERQMDEAMRLAADVDEAR